MRTRSRKWSFVPQPHAPRKNILAERRRDQVCRPRILDVVDLVLVQHQVEHTDRAARLLGPVRIADLFRRAELRVGRERAIGQRRPVDERHDERHLRKRQLLRGLAEIGPAGRFDAVLPAAEVRHVHVFHQQVLPRELALDPQRHDDVADLFHLGRRAAGAAAKMLGDLHGERRCAGAALLEQVLGKRAQDGGLVDPLVLEEVLVFGGENGAHEERRDIGDIVDEDAVLG